MDEDDEEELKRREKGIHLECYWEDQLKEINQILWPDVGTSRGVAVARFSPRGDRRRRR